MATANGPEKKLTLDEAAEKIAAEYPSIFDSANERILFKEDFKLLVRTYVSKKDARSTSTSVRGAMLIS